MLEQRKTLDQKKFSAKRDPELVVLLISLPCGALRKDVSLRIFGKANVGSNDNKPLGK